MATGLGLTANLWTLLGHPSRCREWTTAGKIVAARKAGFDAVTGDFGKDDAERIAGEGMAPIGFFAALTEDEVDAGVARLASWGVRLATVFLGGHDTPPERTLQLALRLHDRARDAGLHAAVETHRNTGTETVEKMGFIVQGFRERTGEELSVTWDFSHYALGKHLEAEEWEERLVAPFRTSIVAARLFHFRPFNAHHCQLRAWVAGRRTPEYVRFLGFVAAIFRAWRAVPQNSGTILYACPEMGPVSSGYSLSHGAPPWSEAIRVGNDLRALWHDEHADASA